MDSPVLPSALREQAESRISALDAKEPRLYHPVRVQPGDVIDTEHFAIALDPKTGAISHLRNKKTGREWASQAHPLALFSYQTLSQEDYTTYRAKYLVRHASWTKKDFGKPNIELFGARNQDWFPSLTNIHYEQSEEGHRVLAQLSIVDPEALHSGRAAFLIGSAPPNRITFLARSKELWPIVHRINEPWNAGQTQYLAAEIQQLSSS